MLCVCRLFLRVVFAGWNFGWCVSHCGYVVGCWFGFGFRYLLRVRLLLLVWFCFGGAFDDLCGFVDFVAWWWGAFLLVWLVSSLGWLCSWNFGGCVMVALGWLIAWCRLMVRMGVLVLDALMVGWLRC